MKLYHSLLFILSLFLLCTCTEQKEISSLDPENWEKRSAKNLNTDSLELGSTYLSVYSEIYNNTQKEKILLGVTVSIRNPNSTDTIFINKAEYFETSGASIRKYITSPVYVLPMETVEIHIDRLDRAGGTGANFIFDWSKKPTLYEPLFESVMIAASGNQGLSFSSKGVRLQ